MRLIEAQLVIKLIENIQYDDRYSNNDEVFAALETVRDCVFNLPTAYDVDKVVDELKFATKKGVLNVCDFTGLLGTEKYKGSFVNTQHTIDIVKRGGVDE